VAELEALRRWSMVLHNQYPWSRSDAALTAVKELRDDDYVVVFHPRDLDVHLFLTRVASGHAPKKAASAAPEVSAPIRPYPALNVRKDLAVQPRIEAIAAVHGEHVCTNEDLIRNSAYNWSPMSADEISAKTGIEARRYTPTHSRTCRCGPPGRRWLTRRWVQTRSARFWCAPAPAIG
jgi:3-oxoacyl-[acyl-carrier-protein] synthase III